MLYKGVNDFFLGTVVNQQLSDIVSRDPNILSGTPVFSVTRVPVDTLLAYLKAGDTLDSFLQEFPSVARRQAEAAIDLAFELILAEVYHEYPSRSVSEPGRRLGCISPLRLSLSKKGFDTENGRGPCPILEDGRMLPLPIPEPRDNVRVATYGSIFHEGRPYVELLRDLGYLVGPNDPAHLDPDLIPEARPRHPSWRGMIGQVDAAESHLRNQGIGSGSIFLFWGWFEFDQPRNGFHMRDGFSAIFGYLEVDHVLDVGVDPVPNYATYHPHYNDLYPQKRNRVYVAREKLSWYSQKPGWGVFNYDPRLRLSIEGKTRRHWMLPGCFHPDEGSELSYNINRDNWGKKGSLTTLQVPARGQEYVCQLNT